MGEVIRTTGIEVADSLKHNENDYYDYNCDRYLNCIIMCYPAVDKARVKNTSKK